MEHVPVHICFTAVKLFWHWTLLMMRVRYLWSYLSNPKYCGPCKQVLQSPACLSVCLPACLSVSLSYHPRLLSSRSCASEELGGGGDLGLRGKVATFIPHPWAPSPSCVSPVQVLLLFSPTCASQGTLLGVKGSSFFLFPPLSIVDSPASGGHQQQQNTHDKQDHRHHFGLRQVIVGVGDTCPSYADHQRDDSEGKDAAVPWLLHAAGGLRQTLQRGEHLRHFGSTSFQWLSFLPGTGLGLVLAGQVAGSTTHSDADGFQIPNPDCSFGSDRPVACQP